MRRVARARILCLRRGPHGRSDGTAWEAKFGEFVGRLLGDLGCAFGVLLMRIGDALGLA